MESRVEIFVLAENGKTYMIEVPKNIAYSELDKIINEKKFASSKYHYVVFKGADFDRKDGNKILHFEEGDKISVYNDRIEEGCVFADFHKNYNLKEDNNINNNIPLTGILRLILIKYISSFIANESIIQYQVIRDIIKELKNGMKIKNDPQNDIKANLTENSGNNIIAYTNYICSIIGDQHINYLLNLLPRNLQNEIKKYWSILSKYEEFNHLFQAELLKAIENSYFDYSLIGLSIYQQNNITRYLEQMRKCPEPIVRYLFHGTRIDPVSKIITNGFLYTRKAFYGMGIYFSDMLDYVAFYSGGKNYDSRRENFGTTLPVNTTFSCVSAEIYYSKSLKKDIYNYNLYVEELNHFPTYEEIKLKYHDKMVEKNGVHFARVEPNQGRVKDREAIITENKRGKFLGTEYVITEMDQILPLYGLTFKRNEYFVLWRDPNFEKSEYSEYLRERKLFIYQYAKMNAYFETSTEKALEIIKRKKYNKIILISNIGLDLGGKRFVEVARKILGFDVVVLFFSSNQNNFSWLQSFPNALYTNQANFYQYYILNYNRNGLLSLKNSIENYYKIKLKFNNDFFQFPKFINEKKFDDIIFEEITPNFKKVIIKSTQTGCILSMGINKIPYLNESSGKEVNDSKWYVTIIGNEITLFSNGSYLGADDNYQKAIGDKYMKRYKFDCIGRNYLFYYENKNNVLTISGNSLILHKENSNKSNQIFKMVELFAFDEGV